MNFFKEIDPEYAVSIKGVLKSELTDLLGCLWSLLESPGLSTGSQPSTLCPPRVWFQAPALVLVPPRK